MGQKEQRMRHRMKTVAKDWTAFVEVPVDDRMRKSAPHLKKLWKRYANSRFLVDCFVVESQVGGIVQCVIARHGLLDEATWSEAQRIKTDLFGPDNFAIEIYPNQVVTQRSSVRMLWIMPAGWEPPCGPHLPTAWGGQ